MTKLRGMTAGMKPWTEAEKAELRATYATVGGAALATKFGRTERAVFNAARRLGVVSVRQWSEADDRRLTSLWDGEMTVRQIANALGRSQITVYWRAQKLRLPLGCPEGFESLSSASKRTGYDRSQIRLILRWAQAAGVLPADEKVERPRLTRRAPGAAYRWTIVEIENINLAVEWWHTTETIEGAAMRRGLVAEVVKNALVTYGRDVPPKLGKKCPWRVPSEVIDAALAERERRESVSAAAKRHGLGRGRLTTILRRAGVRWDGRKQRGVVRAEVERAIAEARAA